jgi:hypothetical protein
MRARRDYNTDIYTIELTESEAMELHEFLSDRARHKDYVTGEPQLEIRICNDLYSCGLMDLFKAKWRKEYRTDDD